VAILKQRSALLSSGYKRDGPKETTEKRFCMNSVCLRLQEAPGIAQP